MQKYVKSRVRVRAAACAQPANSQLSFTVGEEAAIAIELDHDSVKNMEAKPEFYDEAIVLVIDGKETKVKVQAVQRHPFKPKLAHIDFVRA
ncbi:50S ribosomal protein L25 [Serratia rubidaea]|uniref:50S ribosomal protein L25 n=1 Tax=Serratia rubidaea TaxID=61652 RepID=A0A4U9HL78_SERRU|nr:50S ribosomal protein L25 [Serratia rubidaea]